MQLRLVDEPVFEGLEPSDFLQSAPWGRHKAAFGWKPWYFAMETKTGTFPLLVLTRKVLGAWHLAYVTHGPSLAAMEAMLGDLTCQGEGRVLGHLGRLVRDTLRLRLLAVRFEPPWIPAADRSFLEDRGHNLMASGEGDESSAAVKAGDPGALVRETRARFLSWRTHCLRPALVKPPADIQPPDTVILDLGPEPDALLGAMKSKTRYNVRLAQKKGVEVAPEGAPGFEEWYRLYQDTAERDAIAIHSKAYYQRLLEANPGTVELLMARHEGEALAGIIVLYMGSTATYVYGASANIKRNLMATYLLQWVAIQRARERGCRFYDFFGLPPWADQSHPMHGLYQFKTGFGGRVIHYPGAWDLPTQALAYWLFKTLEGLRLYWYRVLKKRR